MEMYLQFMSFPHTDMSEVVELLPTKTHLFYIVNIMGADVPATRGAGINSHDTDYVEPE